MLTTITTMLFVFSVLVWLSYNCSWTVQKRKDTYKVVFIEEDPLFGNVVIGKEYIHTRCDYYHHWKKTKRFHYLDENNVNKYIDRFDHNLQSKYKVL